MYRKIISYTGTVPDPFRDYDLEQRIPEMSKVFRKQSELSISALRNHIDGPPEAGNDRTAMINTLAYQLKDMANRPDTVPSRIDAFKSNVGALGSWLLTMNEQPLSFDYLMLASPNAKLPKRKRRVGPRLIASSMKSFAASFYENYDDFSGGDSGDESISVWITSAGIKRRS